MKRNYKGRFNSIWGIENTNFQQSALIFLSSRLFVENVGNENIWIKVVKHVYNYLPRELENPTNMTQRIGSLWREAINCFTRTFYWADGSE